MADISPIVAEGEARTFTAAWLLGSGDTGLPIRYPGAADRTVQMFGDWDGATIALQGSIDGENWNTLNDAQGEPIERNANCLESITELVRYIRPLVTGGASTSVSVMLFLRTTI